MIKGINPWELPAYRFYNLVLTHLKEDREPEHIEVIEESLARCDSITHPFKIEQRVRNFRRSVPKELQTVTPSNEIEHTDEENLPIEEKKRRKAAAEGKAYRVPDWWRGEAINAKVAKTLMTSLPK